MEISIPCKTTEYKPPTGVKTNLMVGGPEIKGKMMGETEIKSKNKKADTVVTETVKMPNKTDTQEDRKTKAQTWYKGEASSIVTTDIPIDFVSDDVRVRSQDKVSKESRTQKATRPTPIPPPRRKSRLAKKRHASKPPGSTSSAPLSSVRTSPGN